MIALQNVNLDQFAKLCVSHQKHSSKELKKMHATNAQIAQVPSLKRSSNCLKPKALWELTRILAQVRKLKQLTNVNQVNQPFALAQMAIQRYKL